MSNFNQYPCIGGPLHKKHTPPIANLTTYTHSYTHTYHRYYLSLGCKAVIVYVYSQWKLDSALTAILMKFAD